jgi:hypothetical protein
MSHLPLHVWASYFPSIEPSDDLFDDIITCLRMSSTDNILSLSLGPIAIDQIALIATNCVPIGQAAVASLLGALHAILHQFPRGAYARTLIGTTLAIIMYVSQDHCQPSQVIVDIAECCPLRIPAGVSSGLVLESLVYLMSRFWPTFVDPSRESLLILIATIATLSIESEEHSDRIARAFFLSASYQQIIEAAQLGLPPELSLRITELVTAFRAASDLPLTAQGLRSA